MQELERWCAMPNGHLVLTAAERYALRRSTGGSRMTLEEVARLVPHAGVSTAFVIARDIRHAFAVWERDGNILRASDLDKEERELYRAAIERIAKAGFPEGEEWRLA